MIRDPQHEALELACGLDPSAVDRAEIYRCMGYGETIPSGELSDIVEAMISQAVSVCRPRTGYRIVEGVLMPEGRMRLADKVFNPGGIIRKSLGGSDCFALLVASVGHELDDWIKSYAQGDDILKAYVSHMLGACIVEQVVAFGAERLEEAMALEKSRTSNPYSPGYCGWNITEQALFFDLLPAGFCGVRLTESKLMVPVKSVSAVVGIGPEIERKPYSCAICNRRDCYKRKK